MILLTLSLSSLGVKLKSKSCDLVIQPQRLRGIIAEFDIKLG